jgi:hypothetical protein
MIEQAYLFGTFPCGSFDEWNKTLNLIDSIVFRQMNSIISFYSFKHTNDVHSQRPLRKDRNSHFQDF